MLLKLGILWNVNQIKLLIFTVHSENQKYEIQHNCSTVRFLKRSPLSMQYKKLQGGQIHRI